MIFENLHNKFLKKISLKFSYLHALLKYLLDFQWFQNHCFNSFIFLLFGNFVIFGNIEVYCSFFPSIEKNVFMFFVSKMSLLSIVLVTRSKVGPSARIRYLIWTFSISPIFWHVCVFACMWVYMVWGEGAHTGVVCVEAQSWCQLSSLVALYWDSLSVILELSSSC